MKNTYKVVARIELPFEVQCDSDADAKKSVNETLKNMLDDTDYQRRYDHRHQCSQSLKRASHCSSQRLQRGI